MTTSSDILIKFSELSEHLMLIPEISITMYFKDFWFILQSLSGRIDLYTDMGPSEKNYIINTHTRLLFHIEIAHIM